LLAALVAVAAVSDAAGQTTSLARRRATTQPAEAAGRELDGYEGNPTLETHSLIAVRVNPPKTFMVHDLITVIVRQQSRYESDGSLDNKRRFEIESTLDAFIKFVDGGIGAATFRRGNPNIKYKYYDKVKNEVDKEREDLFTTRITAEIIDVKPNGTLVLQARSKQRFENETVEMTLTGVCRSVDVTPDNTVLSTQLADLNVMVKNGGAVRDGSKRGWLQRILDFVRPF
jgi:flagellar L-ring protein precursor FlgH